MNSKTIPIIVILALITLPILSVLYTYYLWFQEINYVNVFLTMLYTKISIFSAVSAFAFLFLFLNIWIAIHNTSKKLDSTIITLIVFVSLFSGFLASNGWETALNYFNQQNFNMSDPVFNNNISFYIFSLPIYSFIWGIVFNIVLIATMATALIYFYPLIYPLILRSVQMQDTTFGHNIKPAVFKGKKAFPHVYFLAGIIFLLIGAALFLHRYSILTSSLGVVFGAAYTSLKISLPLTTLLSALSAITGTVFMISSLIKKIKLPYIFLIGVVFTAIIGNIAIFVVHQYIVVPDEYNREKPYLENNIKFTSAAYDIDDMKEVEFPANYDLTMDDIESNNQTISNVRLWDWRPLLRTYKQVQLIRTYYDFYDVDIDRYTTNGEYKQVMISGREINQDFLPQKTWVNKHLVFTHGYGVAMSPVREVSNEGLPLLLIKDIPPSSENFEIQRPEIYYGELTNDFVIVNSLTEELDYSKGEENVYTTYQGTGGVELSSTLKKLAMSLRFGSIEILLSESVTDESKILMNRNIVERISAIAPFLVFDKDPYIVVDNGKMYWIIDAYTVSNKYPYSVIYYGINYIRNSVKVVVNAYDGETDFYVVNDEPIINTYRKIFPDLFKSFEDIPAGLKAHMRYPLDMFSVQAKVYEKYHMRDARVFYNNEDLWQSPKQFLEREIVDMEPYYLIMKVPGEDKEEFVLLQPFTPRDKNNIIGWVSARSDFPNYGERIVFKFPKEKLIFGPMQIEARIDQDPDISQLFTLWSQVGTRVIRGVMLVIPVEDSILYVEPIYLRAEQESALPELKRVVVAFGDKITMQETLDESLKVIFGGMKGVVEENVVRTLEQLITKALQHYSQSQDYLKQSNWEGYGSEQQKLKETLDDMGKI